MDKLLGIAAIVILMVLLYLAVSGMHIIPPPAPPVLRCLGCEIG